jgi:hypothetical protein
MKRELESMGNSIYREWANYRFSVESFPEVAQRNLKEIHLKDCLSEKEIAIAVCRGDVLPAQISLDEAFGEPPVTLLSTDRFYAEALFWTDGTTAIHEHAFAGAFTVLHGSSLHASYAFKEGHPIEQGIRAGTLKLLQVEILRAGDVRTIPAGSQLIHSLFHLDEPSVTVVVRTPRQDVIEYEYKPPGLAMDPRRRDSRTMKTLQVLKMLQRTRSPLFEQCAEWAVRQLDAWGTFRALVRVYSQPDEKLSQGLTDEVIRRFGEDGLLLVLAAADQQRRWRLAEARREIRDAEARMLLGLLMHGASRSEAWQVLRAWRPEEEPERIVERVCKRGLDGVRYKDGFVALLDELSGDAEGASETIACGPLSSVNSAPKSLAKAG